MTAQTRARLLAACPFLALAALPLVLLACNDAWIWDSTYIYDDHVYVSFFRHYLEFTYPFVENYKSSRLPFVLPGVLLYRVLPDGLAHHLLFLSFLVGVSLLLFVWGRRRFGPHAAFAVAAAQAVFTFSHTGPSYHNVPASMYFMASLVLLDWPARWPAWRRAGLAGGALACALTTNILCAGMTPVFAILALSAVPRPWTVTRIGGQVVAVLAGGVVALALFGALNALLGGPFLFFLDQIGASKGVAERAELSKLPPAAFLSPWRFPWLTLPFFTTCASLVFLAVRFARRRFDAAALAAGCFLVAIPVPVLMQVAGLGTLQYPHLFHVYFTPMFLALAALVGSLGAKAGSTAGISCEPRFLVASSLLLLIPLALLGATFSRFLLFLERTWPAAANGSLVAFVILAVATVVCLRRRFSPAGLAVVAVAAFGLVNAINAPAWQGAYLYDVRHHCSFRRDFFSAFQEADKLIGGFDPDNHGRWVPPTVYFEHPQFDGRGWCSRLPVDAAARDILLSHYFFTSAQFSNGFQLPGPLRKAVIAGSSALQADVLLRQFKDANFSSKLKYELHFDAVIRRPSFTLYLRGYDFSPRP